MLKRITLALLFVLITTLVASAEGCDSSTNANCIETNSNTTSTVNSNLNSTTKIQSPPPSAMSPSINSSSSDTCHIPAGGSVQTQILGISGGTTIRDINCERLKNAKVLYDLGMKVAAVSVMCSSLEVWTAMKNSGTPCPVNNGLVGTQAQEYWDANPHLVPGYESNKPKEWSSEDKNTAKGAGVVGGLLLGLLLFL